MRSGIVLGAVISGCLLLPACGGKSLPVVLPQQAAAVDPHRCAAPFPAGDWQLVHSIEATLPGGHRAFLIGVSVISSAERSIHSVIMTVEGLVLFDARDDGEVTVRRAVAPFDRKGFAAGLMQDVRLVFFSPPGLPDLSGDLADGSVACRYRVSDGGVIDVVVHEDGSWKILRYDRNNRLTRSVSGRYAFAAGRNTSHRLADTVELVAEGKPGYKLVMRLLDAAAPVP